jgi:NAD(P)-dependent dehydrogenase (short-subunit alcohol dehydrogenase family)
VRTADPPVIVITGGSSGVGRATAHLFARRGAMLVLGARGTAALAAAAAECQELGGRAIFEQLDASEAASVEALRDKAVAAFGRVDVWINCAAVLALGPFEATPVEAFERVIKTNLFGYANGARVALSQFRKQECRGTLINVASVLGVVGEPHVSAYVASKFAIRGLTACLRQEVRHLPGIHICCVLPAALDTPIYQHAANYTEHSPRSIVPVYKPERAANAIARLVERPRREVTIGGFGQLLVLGSRLAPGIVEWGIAKAGPQLQFERRRGSRRTGNLFEPLKQADSVTGGWRRYWKDALFGPRPRG